MACVLAVGVFAGLLLSASPATAQTGTAEPFVERYYTKPVQWMIDNNIASDTTQACFGPDIPATRGETALYLWRMQGQPEAPPHPFDDVTDEAQHSAVSWMFDTEITTGTSPTTFAPDHELTRAQLAALLHRLAGEPSAAGHPFGDVVAGWQQQPVAWMVANKITTGTSPTTFAPNEPVTRGQLATFLYRYRGSPEVTVTGFSQPCETFRAIDSGHQHSCAIRSNGAVACWGANFGGQTDAPTGSFKAVSAGTWHSCGLRTDNTITCWGQNTYHQTNAPTGQFTSVSNYSDHNCGIRTNQTITCWGNNLNGQTDSPAGQFTSVGVGSNYTCGIRTNQTITCWGANDSGQLTAPSGRFTRVSAGWLHTCAARTDQTITCWGNNLNGQTDAPAGQFIDVSARASHTCGLRIDNTITCWGANRYGQTNAPTEQFTAVSAAGDHSCGLRIDNTIACWGSDWAARIITPSGQFTEISAGGEISCAISATNTVACWGTDSGANQYDPFSSFTAVSAGGEHACALRTDNTITCWGTNWYGQTNAPKGQFSNVSAGSNHTCAIRDDNTVTCWGSNWGRQSNAPEGQFSGIGAGQDHTCALRSDQTITCWGTDWNGQTKAPEGQFTSISVGLHHNCALRRDNTVTCWGENSRGQTNAPEGQFIGISAGLEHTCALRHDHTVTCWGDPRNSQAEVGSFTAVNSGTWHTCGIRENGEISCWSGLATPAPPGVTFVADTGKANPLECRPFGVPATTAGFPLPSGAVRSKGSVRVAVLFVDFPNAEAVHSTEREAGLGLPYAEAFLEESSYGQLDVEFVPLHRWLRAKNNYEHYLVAGAAGAELVDFSVSVEAVQLADPEVDFTGIDALMVVLPSSYFAGGTASWSIGTDEGNIARQTINNNHPLDESREPYRWGSVAAHELIHNLGLLDMYPYGAVYDTSGAPAGKKWIISEFGLMGLRVNFLANLQDPDLEASWVYPNGYQAFAPLTHLEVKEMLAWSRWQLEWLDSTQISCITEPEATVTLGPIAAPGSEIAMAAIPLSATEVIVVESRRKIGYDRARVEHYPDGTVGTFPTLLTEGVLVYTVDSARRSGDLPLVIAGDTGNLQVDRYPILVVGESVTVRGYTITVQSSTDNTHTITVAKVASD